MKNFENSQTRKNLETALQGEALAHMRYVIYASLIGKTSKSIEKDILEIANNEKQHWKVFAKLLFGEDYYNDIKNLETAIKGETDECRKLYREFADIARNEGFNNIAEKFDMIADIECKHAQEFDSYRDDLINPSQQTTWACSNCGYIHMGTEPPETCPVCDHPKEYFK